MTTTDITTASRAVAVATEMAEAAQAFVDSLDGAQRDVATFPFEGDERYLWHYTPVERNGLRLKEMTGAQRAAAFRMMNTALSSHGAEKAREIIELEAILDEWEGIQKHADALAAGPGDLLLQCLREARRRGALGVAGRRAPHWDSCHGHRQYLRVGAAAIPGREPGRGSARRAQGRADVAGGRGPGRAIYWVGWTRSRRRWRSWIRWRRTTS